MWDDRQKKKEFKLTLKIDLEKLLKIFRKFCKGKFREM